MPRPQTPPVVVDIIIELADRPDRPIVLIERRFPPPGWALPGGFVDVGETVGSAARREALEETGLKVSLDALLGCYSAPERDPRGQTVSLVFVATATGQPVAGDDAGKVLISPPDSPPELAFDHARILADYRLFRDQNKFPLPD